MRCQVKKFISSDLNKFLEGRKDFDQKCLEDLFLICCSVQKDNEKLFIWVNTDSDANPVSIDIYDDQFGIIDASKFQSDYLSLFSTESEFIQSELHEWNDDDEIGQNEIYFTTEDLDSGFLKKQRQLLLQNLHTVQNLDQWHENMKQFIEKCL